MVASAAVKVLGMQLGVEPKGRYPRVANVGRNTIQKQVFKARSGSEVTKECGLFSNWEGRASFEARESSQCNVEHCL